MRYRLRYLKHDLELGPGLFVIGRSPDCQLSLDDPLVSRRHALLRVSETSVTVEDAGSRNGVLVNGTRAEQAVELADGDRLMIGSQEMTLFVIAEEEGSAPKAGAARHAPTLATLAMERPPAAEPVFADSTLSRSNKGEALRLLGSVADKALALGNPDGAERIVATALSEVVAEVRAGGAIPLEMIDTAARFAARLAAGTGKGTWGDMAVELYSRRNTLPPAAIVDELYAAARKMKGFDLPAFRAYLSSLHSRQTELSATERFVLQRLEGLERLLATR